MEYRVPRMDELESRAWLALMATTQLLPNALDQQLDADAGLTSFEYGLLSMLIVAEDKTHRLTDLAAGTNSSLPRLSKVVSRLEARGLVTRTPYPGDGRAINVHLTTAGKKLWLTATPPHLAFARNCVLSALDREQLAELADALEVVVRQLKPNAH